MIELFDLVVCYECGVVCHFPTVWGKETASSVEAGKDLIPCPVCKTPLREKP